MNAPGSNEKGTTPTEAVPSIARTSVSRGLMFFFFWLVLMPSAKPADLLVGLIATGLGTWASVRLLPPEAGHLRFGALLAFVPHFLWQSVLAGFDVARRAFHPRLPLNPGFVECPVRFPVGLARNEFAVITSLMPGSVPAGETEHSILYHALDVGEPLAEQMAVEAKLLQGVLIVGEEHD